ncbi:alpha-L-rhamnosidase C-terminal domain-containing protein [Pedobacter sp.]|uniref:alpha-L-rhamnosidase-related protein n=1 Tax=Pedobacter sp. TaxID=1411316 RepID=UPI0031DC205C
MKNFIGFIIASFVVLSYTYAQQPSVFTENLKKGREKDPRVRVYMSPVRIVHQSDSTGKWIENANGLLKEGNGQAELINRKSTKMRSDKNRNPYIILDFGTEIHGGLQLVTGYMKDKSPVKVRIRFGESVSETLADIDTASGAMNDHGMRDFKLELPWLGGIEVGNSGYRFVRIDLLDPNVELVLKEIRAIFIYRDIPYLGSFKSSDERLNKIWETGAYTVHLNMQQFLWDGIKRDRLVWVGDMHPEVMTINSVFGYNEVVPKSLDLIRDATPLPAWMNGISSYSMWWIMLHRDWYRYQGDKKYLKAQQTYLVGLLNQLMVKTSDGWEQLDGTRFLDWPSSRNKEAIHAGLQALMVMSLTAGAELCEVLGDNEMAKKCRATVSTLARHVPEIADSKQAAALLGLAGLISANVADEAISKGGVNDFSTFYGYYMLQAKAKAGKYQEAIDNIKEYWGGMLDLGATTFWEDFNIEWLKNGGRIDEMPDKTKVDVHLCYGDYCYKRLRHSLSHGWASGPTAWLTEHVLGVSIVEPGAKAIRIRPNLGNLTFVEGTFPTPQGVVKIKHIKEANGKIGTTIDAPKGIKILR